MANCKAELNLNTFWINVTDESDVYESLKDLIGIDNDLSENKDMFRSDTIELGYDSEADRIVKEYLAENKVNSIETYKKAAKEISNEISSQEFFGACEIKFVAINNTTLTVAFATGGN